jgi:hypothetical protein
MDISPFPPTEEKAVARAAVIIPIVMGFYSNANSESR